METPLDKASGSKSDTGTPTFAASLMAACASVAAATAEGEVDDSLVLVEVGSAVEVIGWSWWVEEGGDETRTRVYCVGQHVDVTKLLSA